MLDHDLTVALLCRLNQNQSALGMALEELAIWAKRHEGGETYDVVMNHLQTLGATPTSSPRPSSS
ncbi:hypothetical protein N5K55_09210 [Pseudomonas aeruginosa]|nr:hypothetical protein [Pseudomonas aeruginosa]